MKLVGATAHYVTEDLVRLGADVERAVQWHCEDRVIRYGNQTVVF